MKQHYILQLISQHEQDGDEHLIRYATKLRDAFEHIRFQNTEVKTRNHLQLVFRNFTLPFCVEYHRMTDDLEWQIFQFHAETKEVYNIVTALRNLNLDIPRHSAILSHTTNFEVTLPGNKEGSAFLYSKFNALTWYIRDSFGQRSNEAAEGFTDLRGCIHHLKPLLRRYVRGLLQLHKDGLWHGCVSNNTLVVSNGKGKLLCPYRADSVTTKADLEKLGRALKSAFSNRVWGVQQSYPRSLEILIDCLAKITMPEHCAWIAYTPFILRSNEKIHKFVPRVFLLAKRNRDFRRRLKNIRFDWIQKVRDYNRSDLIAVLNHGLYKIHKQNLYHFFRYVRNALEHLDQRVPKNPGVPYRKNCSNLVLDPGRFIKFITYVYNRFFEDIFLAAFDLDLDCTLHAAEDRFTV